MYNVYKPVKNSLCGGPSAVYCFVPLFWGLTLYGSNDIDNLYLPAIIKIHSVNFKCKHILLSNSLRQYKHEYVQTIRMNH
jgi:hypothetical protein